jgi:hypothetical protein
VAKKIATTCFYGGKDRDIRYKELSRILWQQGGQGRKLRLIIVMPTPHRPTGARKLKYAQPAYLITTDLITSAQALIQAYMDRCEAPRWGPPSSGNFRRRLMLLESGPEDGAGLPGRSRGDDADQS